MGSQAWWEGVLVKEWEKLDEAGCRRLWAAVMYQAIKDVDCGDARGINWVVGSGLQQTTDALHHTRRSIHDLAPL